MSLEAAQGAVFLYIIPHYSAFNKYVKQKKLFFFAAVHVRENLRGQSKKFVLHIENRCICDIIYSNHYACITEAAR